MSLSRRALLRAGGALGVSAAGLLMRGGWPAHAGVLEGAAAAVTPDAGRAESVRRLELVNLHTAERLDLEYFRGNAYVPDSLSAIQVLLRDYRTGDQHVIDPGLMDILYDVAHSAGVDPVFSVISGYRSPQTNERLRERSDGVARHSLHLEGRAIDVRVAGLDCADLAAHAQNLSRGGVGYYRKSNFVHLDTGARRTWNG